VNSPTNAGIDQDTFSEMLRVYASTKMGEAINQSKLRDVNMKQLGTAGPQRVEAVATCLQSSSRRRGQGHGRFLRNFRAPFQPKPPRQPAARAGKNNHGRGEEISKTAQRSITDASGARSSIELWPRCRSIVSTDRQYLAKGRTRGYEIQSRNGCD
jgi:hypothetical protein